MVVAAGDQCGINDIICNATLIFLSGVHRTLLYDARNSNDVVGVTWTLDSHLAIAVHAAPASRQDILRQQSCI